jgi:thiamine pyrophosphokinase
MPEAKVATTEGLLYDAGNLVMAIGGRDGISNEATADEVRIDIESGRLLAFVQRFEGEQRW